MTDKLSNRLRRLLTATILGGNPNHPLAGWSILTILRHNTQNIDSPLTPDFLLQHFNMAYLEPNEAPLTNEVFKRILDRLVSANLIERSSHKVREQMHNGTRHIKQTKVYRIGATGLSFMNGMQKAADAQVLATANVNRIDEYVQLVGEIFRQVNGTETSKLFNRFEEMIDASQDVLRGMHKLDADLSDLADDISFNHGSDKAELLQQLLKQRAIPAFSKMIRTSNLVQAMVLDDKYADQIARSKQGRDSLDLSNLLSDQKKLMLDYHATKRTIQSGLSQLNNSLETTTSAIDNSVDSVYMLYHTIEQTIDLLIREYEHSHQQQLDLRKMVDQLDDLLAHYPTIHFPHALPNHLADDRGDEETDNLLDASLLMPVNYVIDNSTREVATEADNPEIGVDTYENSDCQQGLREFKQVMKPDATGQAMVNDDLEFSSQLARDEVARLYTATAYSKFTSFAPFGRQVTAAWALPNTGRVRLHCRSEKFSVYLPSGFAIKFAETR